MAGGDGSKLRCVAALIACIGAFAACVGAMFHFYGLHGEATLYPYKTQNEQTIVILRTALIATIASSWAIWIGVQRRGRPEIAALWVGVGTEISLTLYGVAGCGGVLGEGIALGRRHLSTNFFFPSLFFSEFNFLTFIFQVAPVTAAAAGLIVYLFVRRFHAAAPHLPSKP